MQSQTDSGEDLGHPALGHPEDMGNFSEIQPPFNGEDYDRSLAASLDKLKHSAIIKFALETLLMAA